MGQTALGFESAPAKKADFSDCAGTWTQNEADEFDASCAGFAEIDEELWK